MVGQGVRVRAGRVGDRDAWSWRSRNGLTVITSSFEAMKSRLPRFSIRRLEDGHGDRPSSHHRERPDHQTRWDPWPARQAFPTLAFTGHKSRTDAGTMLLLVPPDALPPSLQPALCRAAGLYRPTPWASITSAFWWGLGSRRPSGHPASRGRRGQMPLLLRGALSDMSSSRWAP